MNLINKYTYNNQIQNTMSFKKQPEDNRYNDPLKEWPLRGCAYSNELGAAIHSIAPKVGTALWIPALMYFGAAIYDKYKNDETEYNPSKKRGLKETAFQALASVILPTAAVGIGQKAASSLTRLSSTGLSVQSQIEVLEKSMAHMQEKSLHTYENNPEKYAAEFEKAVLETSSNARSEFKALSFIKKALSYVNPFKDNDTIAHANTDKLGKFARKQASEIMEMRSSLMKDEKPQQMSDKLYKKFKVIQSDYKNIHPADKYMGKAAKAILKEYHSNLVFKNKLIKTAGGFIGLGLLIKPIDDFVENIIIKKTVEPGLDYISENYKKSRERYKSNNISA